MPRFNLPAIYSSTAKTPSQYMTTGMQMKKYIYNLDY